MNLTTAALMCIRSDREIRQYIMKYYAISRQTLYNWINQNDPRLADRGILTLLSQKSGLDEALLIELI